jgi:SAM-dependent methyltransferase
VRRVRRGQSIREFLAYYVLVLLASKPGTKRELIKAIAEASRGNRSFRPSGVLRVASAEMGGALKQLAEHGWLRGPVRGKRWRITSAGRAARWRQERDKEVGSNAKERAARKVAGLLSCDGRGRDVLDVGTGEGYLAFKVAERGCRVLGIDSGAFDYSKDSIQRARQEAAARGGTVDFRRADVTRLSRLNGAFDYIVSSQAVHCMRDQAKCLAAIYRLLKPGGSFLCSDFLVGRRGFLRHGFHCFLALSREEWEELLRECGFGDTRMYEVDDYLVVQAQKPA